MKMPRMSTISIQEPFYSSSFPLYFQMRRAVYLIVRSMRLGSRITRRHTSRDL